eukprot:scaffold7012_cov166-Ochromonas_danica.AAC.11
MTNTTTTTAPQDQLLSNLGLILFATLPLYHWYRIWQVRKGQELKTYNGSCHCGEVCFTVKAAKHLVVWDCNCSICYMKKNWHFIVPAKDFRVTSGVDFLTEYRFNTKMAKHLFCKKCGVQAFYIPRSNPDGVAVTLACIKQSEIESVEVRGFDGNNWESFYKTSNIQQFSQSA